MEQNLDYINNEPEHMDSSKIKKNCVINNKFLLYFNIFLLISLILLYILFFTQNKHYTNSLKSDTASLKIAWIDTDSLRTHYLLVKDMRDTLEQNYNRLQNEMRQRQNTLEAKAKEYQNKINANLLTVEQAQKIEQQLMIEQQTLYDLKETYSNQLSDQEYDMNERFVDSVSNFLARYKTENNFDYVLAYSKGGGILYANKKFDITSLVIEGLNKEYKNFKNKKR
jgi:outer membrane protein